LVNQQSGSRCETTELNQMTPARAWVRTSLTAAGLLLISACGLASAGPASKGSAAAGPAASQAAAAAASSAPATVGPMAKMPAGTKLSLVRPGRLTVCEGYDGWPFLSPKSSAGTGAFGGTGPADKDVGFDADLLLLIGQRIGATPVVIANPVSPQDLLAGKALTEKFCDVFATGMDNPGNFPQVSASISYFRMDSAILTSGSKHYTSVAQLAGKRVGALRASGQDELAAYNSQHGDTIAVQRINDANLLVYGLRSGRFDAVVIGNAQALFSVVSNPNDDLRVTAGFGQAYSRRFAVRAGNMALLDQINAALTDAAHNGQYAKAYRDWLGISPAVLPAPER
jgi:ABC-type amino acid transport substrate-binding protein